MSYWLAWPFVAFRGSARLAQLAVLLTAALALLSTCILPPEPSSEEILIEFELPGDTVRLAIGAEFKPDVRVTADGNPVASSRLRFESLDPTIIAVDSTGTVRALRRGLTSIRVVFVSAAAGTEPPDTTFPIRGIVAAIQLPKPPDTLTALNDTALVRLAYLDAHGNPLAPAESAAIKPRYQLSSPGRAVRLDSAGTLIVAKANETDTLRATVDTAGVPVVLTVRQRATRVLILPEVFQFQALGETRAFEDSAWDRRGYPLTDRSPVWSSSDTTVVSISSAGIATAKRKGDATVTASVDRIVDSAAVSVVQTVSVQQSVVTVSRATVPSGDTATIMLQAKDALSNDLTSGGLKVEFTDSGGTSNGKIGPTTDHGNGRYTATFTAESSGTPTTVRATINDVRVTSAAPTVSVVAGTPYRLVFQTQPHDTIAGVPFRAIRVAVQDSAGNTVTGATSEVKLDSAQNAQGKAELYGDRTQSAVNGLSTFDGISVINAGRGYRLRAISGTLETATSDSFDIAHETADKLGFLQQPTADTLGQPISPAVSVAVQDIYGNTVTTAANVVIVDIASHPSGAQLTGTKTVGALGGVATFDNLVIDRTGQGYTLTASAAALSRATSDTFSILAGPPAKLAFLLQPTNTQAGAALTPAVQVVVQDAAGNTVTTATNAITLAIGTNPGSGTLSGTTTVSAVNGVATFTNLTIDRVGTGYTLTAAASELTGAASAAFNITVGAATKLAFAVQPSNTQAGAVITAAVQVAVQDPAGNTVTTATNAITVAIATNPGSGTLSGTTTVNAVSGVATFSNLSIDKVGTGYALSASAGGLTGATSAAFSITVAAASRVAFTVQPSTTQAGTAITPAVQLVVQDAAGNTVATATDAITVAIGTNPASGTLAGTTTVNAVSGVATFSNLSINNAGAGYTLAASATGLTGVTSSAFDVVASSATKLAFTVQPNNTQAGGTITPAVQVVVQDAAGNTVTTATNAITLAIGTNPASGTLAGTTTVNAVSGVATFTNLSINNAGVGYTLTAGAGGLSGVTSSAFDVVASSGTKLAFAVQPSTAQAGAAITPAVQVVVQDAAGNTVTTATNGITVAIGTNPAGGTLGGTTTVSAVNGVATFSNLSIDKVGTGYTLSAAAGGLTGATSSAFNITVGAASKLAFTVQPSTAQAGTAITPALQVVVQDAAGNTVSTATNAISLAIGTNPASGTLAGTATVSAVSGAATFSNLSIDKVGAGYTLSASAGGLTGATSAGFTITAGAATKLVFVVQPSNTQAGGAITPAVQAVIQDAAGNPVTTATNAITVAIGTNPAGGTLAGTTTVSAVNGVATFSNLSIDKVGTGYTLSASAGVLTGATSAAFNITVASASRLAFTVQPSNTQAGAAIAPAVQVAVQDAAGNTVTTATNAITVAIGTNPASGTLAGTATVSAVSGVATFSNLSIDKVAAGYTLSASAGGLTGATSAAFNITVASATKLVFVVQPSNTQAGAAITPAVQVAVQDAAGNTVTTATNAITVAIGTNLAGGTLAGTTTVSAANGVATFSNLSIDNVGNGYTLGTSAAGLTGATSAPFNVITGPGSKLAFLVQPTNTQAGAAIAPAVQVAVQDAAGNTVPSATNAITLAIGTNPGGGTLSGTATVTAVNGVATFSNLSIDKVGTGYTLTASAGGLTAATSATFNITAGPTAAVVVSPAGASISGVGATQTFTAEARDANGNVIPGKTFTWASLNPNVATINTSTGVATAVASGQVTISATVDGKIGYALLTVAIPGASAVNLWTPMTSGTSEILYGLWGAGPSDFFASGTNGTILRYNGSTWTAMSSGTTQTVPGLWGTSSTDVWTAGASGTILHYNGSAWASVPSGTTTHIGNGLWGVSPVDVFVSGENGTILRYNGSSWTPMTSGVGAGNTIGLGWGSSASDVFAAGALGTILHFDGTSWTAMSSGTSQNLSGPWGLSPTEVYMTGHGGTILRYNGTAWSSMTSGTIQNLNGMWGSSSTDIYVAGDAGTILRYNATSWSAMTSGTATQLIRVWGTSSGDVIVTGTGGTILRGVRGATVTATPPNPTLTALGATQQLTATAKDVQNNTIGGVTFIWSSSSPSVATVSSSGLVTAVANGTATITATAPGGAAGSTTVTVAAACATVVVTPAGATVSTPGGTQAFTAECRDANGNVISGKTFTWASLNPNVATINSSTGVATAVASGQVTISATVDGKVGYALLTLAIPGVPAVNLWSQEGVGTTNDLFHVWGIGGGDVYAVGTLGGGVLKRTGSGWSAIGTGTDATYQGVWGSSANDVFIVGAVGKIARFNGTTWSATPSPTASDLRAVWGSAPNDVFAVGASGTILHYDGLNWSSMASPTTQYLAAIWGSSRGDVFVSGFNGTILHYDGTSWTPMSSGTTLHLGGGAWGTSPTHVYTAGLDGIVLRYDGNLWSAFSTGTATGPFQQRNGIYGTSSGDVYMVGELGRIFRNDGSTWSQYNSGSTQLLYDVWSNGTADVFVVGNGGTILRGVRGATVTVTPATPTLTALGATQQLTGTAKDAQNNTVSGVTFTWTSSDTTKVRVSATGLVTAVANGTATVTASAPGGAAGSTTVTVNQVAASVVVTPDSGAVMVSNTRQLTVTVRDANNNLITSPAVSWATSSTSVATVDGAGLVTGVVAGSVLITATSGSLSDTASITVIAFSDVSAGWRHTCGITTTGITYCWGGGGGALGNGSYDFGSSKPVPVSGGLTFSSVSVGLNYTCAVSVTAAAYCWGSNGGQLGNGSTVSTTTPVPVSGGLAFASVSAGVSHTCGRSTGGTSGAYCWGLNGFGQLGNGSRNSSTTPVAESRSLYFESVAVGGYHSCAIAPGGGAFCWGRNYPYGQLGIGSTTDTSIAEAVQGGHAFTQVRAGEIHTCGLTTTGAAYCWGAGGSGSIGNGSNADQSVPTGVSGGLTFTSVTVGGAFACALVAGGSAYCWGSNGFGNFGNGTTGGSNVPVLAAGGQTFSMLSAGEYHACGVTGGAVYCWGRNEDGQLGNGMSGQGLQTSSPVRIANP